MKTFFLISALLFSVSAFTQGILSFDKKEILLNKLKADDIPVQVMFKFKNTGNQPILITRVNPDNKLLKAEWSKIPLKPGASATIELSFIPAEVPEKFNYTILVTSNAKNSREQLTIQGNVIDNPQKPNLLYKLDMEGLKFKSNMVAFDNIYNNQKKSDTLYFYNSRKDDVTLEVDYLSPYINIKTPPTKITPGKQGMLIVDFDATKKNAYGYVYESAMLIINNRNSYTNRITITANISEDFSKLTPQDLRNAPIAFCEKKEICFGSIKPGAKANCDFILTNKGKRELIIRKTSASCGCTIVVPEKLTIAPGKSTTIRTTFDSEGKSGHQYKSITIITNDPKNPELVLTISGDIK